MQSKTDSEKRKLESHKYGLIGELICVIYLFFKGYITIKRRYNTKYGEIDLICVKRGKIIFVEVKSRKGELIELETIVSKNQWNRIIDSSKYFVRKNSKYFNFEKSYDLVVVKNYIPRMHFKNVTMFF